MLGIVIVEDDPNFRAGLEAPFSEKFWCVVACGNNPTREHALMSIEMRG